MFKCAGCPEKINRKRKVIKNQAGLGVTQFKVTIVKRKVLYINQIRYDKDIIKEGKPVTVSSFKNVSQTTGFETVKEKWYCAKHLPTNVKVRVLDKIIERKNLIGIRKGNRGDN